MDLILGHNQFLGISHISEEMSREREKRFSNVKNIYAVVEKAVEVGFKGMIIETHPRMLEFLEYYERNRTFDIDFYLQVPYVQGYIKKMNEKGMSGLISEVVQRAGFKNASLMALKNILNFAKKDYISLATSALQLEVAPFTNIKIKALFLHNIITDLLLSLHIKDVFNEYIWYAQDKLEISPGFITINFHLLKQKFDSWDIKPDFIMTPVNPIGYDMNPSKQAVETSLHEFNGEIIAMNILGGGAFSVQDSYNYLKSMNIKYCVVGASSKEHLMELSRTFTQQ